MGQMVPNCNKVAVDIDGEDVVLVFDSNHKLVKASNIELEECRVQAKVTRLYHVKVGPRPRVYLIAYKVEIDGTTSFTLFRKYDGSAACTIKYYTDIRSVERDT